MSFLATIYFFKEFLVHLYFNSYYMAQETIARFPSPHSCAKKGADNDAGSPAGDPDEK